MKDQHATRESQTENQAMDHSKNYQKLAVMTVLSFFSMYVLMYAMVNVIDNVYNSLNQVYMAGLMTAPMVIFALTVMGMMYPNKRRNLIIITASLLIGLLFFAFIRQQTIIGDQQFLRSMIPHHAGAITMCERAPITDPEIQTLCESIISSQQEEIDQMQAILERLEG
jgi:uncharacterized protein (DUF305 family)